MSPGTPNSSQDQCFAVFQLGELCSCHQYWFIGSLFCGGVFVQHRAHSGLRLEVATTATLGGTSGVGGNPAAMPHGFWVRLAAFQFLHIVFAAGSRAILSSESCSCYSFYFLPSLPAPFPCQCSPLPSFICCFLASFLPCFLPSTRTARSRATKMLPPMHWPDSDRFQKFSQTVSSMYWRN